MQSSMMVERLEAACNRPLTDDEKYEIDLWSRGRALAQISLTEGYQEILAMLQSYAGDAVEKLMAVVPGDTKETLAQHAVAYAAGRIYSMFQQDVSAAVNASAKTPDVIKNGFRAAPAPPESL